MSGQQITLMVESPLEDSEEENDLKTQVEEFLKRTRYCNRPEKPPLSYSALITMAIVTSDQLYFASTKSIIDFISTKFVHFREVAAKSWVEDVRRECSREPFRQIECKCPFRKREVGGTCEQSDEDLWAVCRPRAARTLRVAIMADREASQMKRSRSLDEDSNKSSCKKIRGKHNGNENNHAQSTYRGNVLLKKRCEELVELSIKFPKCEYLNNNLLRTMIAIEGSPKDVLTTSEVVKSVSQIFPHTRCIDIARLRKSILEDLDKHCGECFEKMPDKNGECQSKLSYDDEKLCKVMKRIRSNVLKILSSKYSLSKKTPESANSQQHPTSLEKSQNRSLDTNMKLNGQTSNNIEQQKVEQSDEDLIRIVKECIVKNQSGRVTHAEAERYVSQRRGARPDLAVRIDLILRNRPDVFLQVPTVNGYWSLRPTNHGGESSPGPNPSSPCLQETQEPATTQTPTTIVQLQDQSLDTNGKFNDQTPNTIKRQKMKEVTISIERCPIVERRVRELMKKVATKSKKISVCRFRRGWIVRTPNTFQRSAHQVISMLIRDQDFSSEWAAPPNHSYPEEKRCYGIDVPRSLFRGWDKVDTSSRDFILQKINKIENNEDLEKVMNQCFQRSSLPVMLSHSEEDKLGPTPCNVRERIQVLLSNLPTDEEPPVSFPALVVSAILADPENNCAKMEDICKFIGGRFPYYRYTPGRELEWQRTVQWILEHDSRFGKVGNGSWSVGLATALEIIERAASSLRSSNLSKLSRPAPIVFVPVEEGDVIIDIASTRLVDPLCSQPVPLIDLTSSD